MPQRRCRGTPAPSNATGINFLPQMHPTSIARGASAPAFWGKRPVHEVFAKIARFAFGKGAAFCYAVAVAVSGQL